VRLTQVLQELRLSQLDRSRRLLALLRNLTQTPEVQRLIEEGERQIAEAERLTTPTNAST
jgi:hypothetical protein